MYWGADYILILGADQMFEEDTLIRMAAHLGEWDMVSGLVPSRGRIAMQKKPFGAYGYRMKMDADAIVEAGGDEVWDLIGTEEGSGQIHSIGTGILLLPAHVFKTLGIPWFIEYINPGKRYGRRPIMDTQFVKKCTIALGLKLYLDVTIKSKHLDVFQIDETYGDRFSDVTRENWVPAMGDNYYEGEEDGTESILL
jgi:hypothetical protein